LIFIRVLHLTVFHHSYANGGKISGQITKKTTTWEKVVFHEELDETRNNGNMISAAMIQHVSVNCKMTWVCDGRCVILGPVKDGKCDKEPA